MSDNIDDYINSLINNTSFKQKQNSNQKTEDKKEENDSDSLPNKKLKLKKREELNSNNIESFVTKNLIAFGCFLTFLCFCIIFLSYIYQNVK